MRSKVTACLGGLLALCLGWLSWRHASSPEAVAKGTLPALRPDVPYALTLSNHETTFDLEFDSHDAYRLIVSNFGTVDETARVSLSATPVDAPEKFPGERVGPLPVRALVASSQGSIDKHGGSTPMLATALSSDLSSEVERVVPTGHVTSSTERDFYLHVTEGALENPEGYARVHSKVMAEGTHCRVYLDVQQPRTAALTELGEELVRIFEEEVLPRSRAAIGTHRDVDGDGKLALLVTPWLGKLQGGETTLKGFTRSSDFRTGIPAPFSNQCDVIYLHSQLRPGPLLRDLLAHEYAHAVSFSLRQGATAGEASLPDEEDWISEGVAHLAENLAGSGWTNLDYRISRFLDDPARSPLIVSDYYRTGLWRDHGCRGATYLFLRWCTDVWGDPLPAALLRSPMAGAPSLERLTGLSFPQLYRHFNLALASAGDTPAPGTVAHDSPRSVRPLESVALFGRVGGWQLAGPRWDAMSIAGPTETPPKELVLRGTATAFVELRAAHAEGTVARRIRIQGSPACRLQVTLLRCRPDSPRLNLAASWESGSEPRTDVRTVGLILKTASELSSPLHVESVSLEQNFDETRRSVAAQMSVPNLAATPAVDGITLPSAAGGSGGLAHSLRVTVAREPLVGASGPWQVKVVARDPLGRRVSASVPLPEWREAVPGVAQRDQPALR